jgi:glutaredoxin
MQIDIYYTSICGLCTQALETLRSKNLSFTAHAVEWNHSEGRFIRTPTVEELYRRCNQEVDFVPHIFINTTHIAGWKELEPLVTSGAFDKMIAAGHTL